jgi:hypothetical protein
MNWEITSIEVSLADYSSGQPIPMPDGWEPFWVITRDINEVTLVLRREVPPGHS